MRGVIITTIFIVLGTFFSEIDPISGLILIITGGLVGVLVMWVDLS